MSLKAILGSAAGALSAGLRPPAEPLAGAGATARQADGSNAQATPILARAGAALAGLRGMADLHLQVAGQAAAADSSRWSIYGQGLQAAQDLIGGLPGQAQAAAQALAGGDIGAGAQAAQAVFAGTQQAAGQLGVLSAATDAEAQARLSSANDLLAQIASLNREISAARLAGRESSAAQHAQDGLATQLAALVGSSTTRRSDGGLDVRTADGVRLAGDTAASLVWSAAPGAAARIGVVAPDGQAAQPVRLDSGEIRGLLDLRNDKLPQMTAQLTQLGQVAGQAVYAGQGGAAQAASGLARTAESFAATLSRDAAAAQDRQAAAAAVATEADGRRQQLAGLNVGQELANLAAYQQAASATAQMSEGARNLSQALLQGLPIAA